MTISVRNSNMNTASRVRSHNSRAPSPPDLDEDRLFETVFDWQRFCQSENEKNLPNLITEIPSILQSLSLDPSRSAYKMSRTMRSEDDVSSSSDFFNGDSPPDLEHAGSTSPSENSSFEHVDEATSPTVSLSAVQAQDDKWTYPPQDATGKALPSGYTTRATQPEIVAHSQSGKSSSLDQTAKLKRRRSGQDLDKRQRYLVDPDQTAVVRKSGACVPCRVSKIRCHENGVCPTCRKAFPDHSHLVCTRVSPAMNWPIMGRAPNLWSRYPIEEEQLCESRRKCTGLKTELYLYLTSDMSSVPMRVAIQASEQSEMSHYLDFPREHVPSHGALQSWVEEQIKRDGHDEFSQALQRFLFAYALEGKGLPKHSLVSKVHKMNCFFRIWKTPEFWYADQFNNPASLPLSLQARLRKIAFTALKSVEHDVLKELDDCIAQQGLKTQERLATWASMWQLIMMYRELMIAFPDYLAKLEAEQPEETIQLDQQRVVYHWLGNSVFPLIAILYHYQFRTKKGLDVSLDWLKGKSYPTQAKQSRLISQMTQELLVCRKDFCSMMQDSTLDVDRLLCILVVNHEIKKMNARQRKPAKKGKSAGNEIEDECSDNEE